MKYQFNCRISMRLRSALAIFALLLTGPVVSNKVSAQTASFTSPAVPGGGFNVDMSSMLDRQFFTVVRQQYDFSCGSAALATLLHFHYGIPADENSTFMGMWDSGDQEAIRMLGFSLLDMKKYLASIGLETQGFRVSLDQISKTGIPGIALTVTEGYRHFVVIKGVNKENVLIGDPSRGIVSYPRVDFEKIWDGLYFVITDAREVGKQSFNRTGQWASIAHAPVDSELSKPTDYHMIRLAAPALLLGEF